MAQCASCKTETELYDNGVPVCVKCVNEPNVKRKPPATEDQVRNTLIQDIVEATALKNEASGAFEIVMGQFPSGLPPNRASFLDEIIKLRSQMFRDRKMRLHGLVIPICNRYCLRLWNLPDRNR